MLLKFKTTLVALAAIATLAMPLAAVAQSYGTQVTYKTAMVETTPMSLPGYFPGTLKLTVANDGAVSGWYYPDYGVPAIPVTGSYQRDSYWLSFGNGNFHIDATKQANGKLVGSAQRVLVASHALPQTFNFVATPTSG